MVMPFPPEPKPEHRKQLPIEYGPGVFTIEGFVDAGNDMRDYQEPDAHEEGAEPEVDPAVFAQNRVRQRVLRVGVRRVSQKFADEHLIENRIRSQQARYRVGGIRPDYNISDYSESVYREDQSSHFRHGTAAGDSRGLLQPGLQLQRVNRWLQRDNIADTAMNSTIDIQDINADINTPNNRRIDSGLSLHRPSVDFHHLRAQSSGSTLTPLGSSSINMFRRSVHIEGGFNLIHGVRRPSNQQIFPPIISEVTQEQRATPQMEEDPPSRNAELESDEASSMEERKSDEKVKKKKKNKQKKLKGAGKLEKRTKKETMLIYNKK